MIIGIHGGNIFIFYKIGSVFQIKTLKRRFYLEVLSLFRVIEVHKVLPYIHINFTRRVAAGAAAVALTAGALLAPAEAAAQVNAEQVLTIGRNVLSMEDYLLAIQYFNLAIKSKPYLADAYFLRGLAKLSLDDYEGAVADCTLALERNKYKSEAYKVRGFALMNLNKDSLAVEDYRRGLDYNPTDKYFLYYKGVAEIELKRYEAADSTLVTLLRLHPRFDDAIVARGRLNVLRGDTVRAIEDFDRALKVSKSQLNAYLMKADIAASRGEWKEALDVMDEAIRLRPEEADFYVNRAYLRYNNEDFFGAMSDYNYALQLNPQNIAAIFNRALLRTEVKELENAEQDFSTVLQMEPDNFHALYNRGLVRLELGHSREALADFREISRRYPKFHPAYYAMAECYRQSGNLQEMADNIKKGDRLVSDYVANPSRNPLDRPTIAPGKTNNRNGAPETDEEFMARFNQLVTSSEVKEQQLSFNDRIKGRVQDRNINVEPEPAYALSFIAPDVTLRNSANYFRDLENLNQRRYIDRKIYLRPGMAPLADEDRINEAFRLEGEFDSAITSAGESARPIDYLARGLARTMLRDYNGAIDDITRAIENTDDFAAALFARSCAYYARATSPRSDSDHESLSTTDIDLHMAMADLDALLKINPRMVYAWFNKGLIYYRLTDYTSAMQCFSEALKIDPDFGEAYYNRGLAGLQQGNRQQAFADLSKAGELGVLPSYNLLKRMK